MLRTIRVTERLVTSQIARLMTTTNTDTTGPWGRNAMDIRGGLVFTIFPRKSNPQVGFQVYCTTLGFSNPQRFT